MPGGLLNISSVGEANVLLTGNPTKTFFKATYSKYTNFGLQKFRLDYTGQRELRLTEPSVFSFKVGRYADLLMDTYLSVTLPDIWSPIFQPCAETNNQWAPYEFRWISNLGSMMIKEITITCGGSILQKYSGQYLAAMMERDFPHDKKKAFYEMTGNIPELNDPANAFNRVNSYPNAFFIGDGIVSEPSIRSKTLYIPINTWFTLNNRCAFPLVCLQYNELYINVTLRPIQELFMIRDVFDVENNFPYIQPDFNQEHLRLYRFLQSPPSTCMDDYTNTSLTGWNADVHLVATYCFLSEEERHWFAKQDQVYLIKDVVEYSFENIVGTKKINVPSSGLVSNWMWFFQRNDVNMRNQWDNYTNWPYKGIPSDVILAPRTCKFDGVDTYGPGANPPVAYNGTPINTGYYVTTETNVDNIKEIMSSMGILLNGEYRENMLPFGVYKFLEKYSRSEGAATNDGIYCYNFCLNTSPFEYQPSGVLNMSKFKIIEMEITTNTPPQSNSEFTVICDQNGNPIATNKSTWKLYDYVYNMTLFEERYNILSFVGGNCGMLYAR